MPQPLTVSMLSAHIAQLFDSDTQLRDLWVSGEVSNWKRAASGHIYFNLKDSGANLAAVMWRTSAQAHSWLPNDGDQIIAHGYVGVYPERGVYQLYANQIQPAGRGQLYAQFEALKARLNAAGLFAAERKRPIVARPQRIGVITSADGAALRDILRVLVARWPLVEIILFPSLVQGSEAPAQIVQALTTANHFSATYLPIDTLILARGGGSVEDLWAFNDEQVAYALVASNVPVIAGVGHEVDFTIADFVADLRAPTPSAAAAAAVPDRTEVLAQLADLREWLLQARSRRLLHETQQLDGLRTRLQRIAPLRQLDLRRQRLDDRAYRLHQQMLRRIERLRSNQATQLAQLNALNPTAVLQRGYSIVQRPDGVVVTTPAMATPGTPLLVRAAGGDYTVTREPVDR